MSISDILGIAKLVEVCAPAIGGLCAPWQMKRLAKAQADIDRINADNKIDLKRKEIECRKIEDDYKKDFLQELRKICESSKNDKNLLVHISDEHGMFITSYPDTTPEPEQFLLAQTKARFEQQEMRRQINRNNVVVEAANVLKDVEHVPEEKPDDDWTARFFDTVQDISDQDMQQLWSRVLAGELEHPRTYSKRSLDILRNISKQEAETFAKIGALALYFEREAFLIYPSGDHNWLEKNIGISLIDMQKLFETGIILPNENFCFDFKENKITINVFFNKIFKLYFSNEKNRRHQSISCFKFTSTGRELLNLVTPIENKQYINKLFKDLKEMGLTCYKLGIDEPIPDPQIVTCSLDSETPFSFS